MVTQVSAQDARNNFSEVLNTAVFGKKKVIITRFDKPQAVLMDYQEYQRLMDPRSRFTHEEWEKGFAVFDRIRARTKRIPAKQIERIVNEEVLEVRRKHRVPRSR